VAPGPSLTLDPIPIATHVASTAVLLDFPVGNLTGRYPAFVILTRLGGNPFNANDWLGVFEGLRRLLFHANIDLDQDRDGDGWLDTDQNRDGYADNDRNFNAVSEDLIGRISGVIDGDTVRVRLAEGEVIPVRLAEIDAPESDQPYGGEARQALFSLIFDQWVQVEPMTTDAYGRLVGQIYLEGIWVSEFMVCNGHAWAYRKYLRHRGLLECERRARDSKMGLWARANPVPPWEWRQQGLNSGEDRGNGDHDENTPSCGDKKYCYQMSSCEEAYFYYEQCGVERLDGDGDGIPCEELCR